MAAGCGSRVFRTTAAGLCFLVFAISVASSGLFILDLASPTSKLEWTSLGQFALTAAIFTGGVAFLLMGLSMSEDLLPRERPAVRPLRYLVVFAIVLALALVAIPLFPVGAIAMITLRMFGPALSWVLTRRCDDCIRVRSEHRANAGPVYCSRHDRLFDETYRRLVSND